MRARVILLAALVTLLCVLLALLTRGHYLSLEYWQAQHGAFQALRVAHPLLVPGGFFALYVLATTLNVPGMEIATLAGGALFGFWTGLVLVSFASTIGATCAFLSARFLLRDKVQRRFGKRLTRINEGVRQDGARYLLSLRLMPLVPFFATNLVMGLTPMRPRTFYWASQLGMLPATALYVNAGSRIGELDSAAGLLSPTLIASLALLAALPWLAKWLGRALQRSPDTPAPR